MQVTESGKKPTFEQAIAELEELVDRLESGDVTLEQAMKLYERGVELSRRCSELLDEAERKIEVLRENAAGTPQVEQVDEQTLLGGAAGGADES